MKALVVYDSYYGNTEKIAQVIAETLGEALGAPEVSITRAKQAGESLPEGLALLVVGGPTRAFSATQPVKGFLSGIPRGALDGVKVAAFDTRSSQEEIDKVKILALFVRCFGYAAKPIASRLTRKGGALVAEPEGFCVSGTEGPLVDGEAERAAAWARQIASAV